MPTIGNYELLEQIGQGGSARTYLARHVILGELACLKQNLLLSSEEEESLLREAKILWHIHHHSLPTLRDYIRMSDQSCVLVMTYVDGKDLYKIVEEDYPTGIHPEHVCWIMQRLLNALQYLHFHGIIHTDIKPQNIIIKPQEHNAVLVDYGISTLAPKRRTVPIGHTPAFAAPEQQAKQPPLPATDLYSLGLSMLYALGGDIGSKTYPLQTPQELQKFINRLLLHDLRLRPQSAEELIAPLSDLRLKLFGRRHTDGKVLKVS